MDYIWDVKMNGNGLTEKALQKKILKNPASLTITVGDWPHGKQSKYSRWSGSCYELADVLINGRYNGGKSRPFMFYAMQELKKDPEFKKTLKFYMKAKKGRNGGITVDWEGIGIAATYKVQQLLTKGKLGLAALESRTMAKRAKAGYNENPPLVASGKLAEAITFAVNGV